MIRRAIRWRRRSSPSTGATVGTERSSGDPERGDWIGLAELSSDRADIDRRLSQLEAAWGGHAGYAATSLIQQVSHPLVSLMSWCVLFGTDIPAIGPESVWLRQHPHGLFDRVAISGDLLLPQESSMEGAGEAAAIGVGATIVDSLSPLVGAIREVRKVGLAGLWHGVRDLVARTLLMAGSALGSVETGMSAAEAILTRAPDRHSGHSSLASGSNHGHVVLPEERVLPCLHRHRRAVLRHLSPAR